MMSQPQKNDAIAQQYKRYLTEKAQRQEAERLAAEEKVKTQAYWAEKKKPKTVITRKPHECADCGAVIPKGSKVVVRAEFVNVSSRGYTMQFLTKYFCGKCRPMEATKKMAKYTKEQINNILGLKGWIDTQIDAFNLYAVLTIGVTNNTQGPGDSWEIAQKTYSEKALDIKLEDFASCTSKADVKKRFNEVMKKAVSGAMFKGDKVW